MILMILLKKKPKQQHLNVCVFLLQFRVCERALDRSLAVVAMLCVKNKTSQSSCIV